MTREDMEALSMFVAGMRDAAQALVDACNLFLEHLEASVVGVPQDPAIWEEIEWEDREKEDTHFKYQMTRVNENNELHRKLRMLLKQKKGKATIGPYRYSLGTDESVIFRNLVKKNE
jgi:hypothetical protein